MPVFFDEKQTKGVVYACFTPTQAGLAPLPFKGGIGRGVEKSQINLLLTSMNTVDLSLKFFDSKLFSKLAHCVIINHWH
jgi:hypothetical protein